MSAEKRPVKLAMKLLHMYLLGMVVKLTSLH